MEENLRELIEQVIKGDMEAFEKVYRATSNFVYNVVLRVTNNRADAEEVTQDVFVKIYKNIKKFEFRSSFKTWAYRIAVNTAINMYHKTTQETKRRGDFDVTLQTYASSVTTDESAYTDEQKSRLAAILDILNPQQRACIVLREIEGLSYQEIAAVLKTNVNTVRSRLKRARQALIEYGEKEVIANAV